MVGNLLSIGNIALMTVEDSRVQKPGAFKQERRCVGSRRDGGRMVRLGTDGTSSFFGLVVTFSAPTGKPS